MAPEQQGLSKAQRSAVDAMEELKVSRDAYLALEALVDVDVPAPLPLRLERNHFGALMRVINTRFAHDLARAQAAMQAASPRP